MYSGLNVAFSLKLHYFNAFKEVDLSERGLPDHSEHEGGESAEPETEICEKVVGDSLILELDFSRRRPWWEKGV